LSNNKQILIKSTRLAVILTIVNVVLSLALSKVFSGGLEPGQITGWFGNVTLLEAMVLLLYGGAVDFTSSIKWVSVFRLLRIPARAKEEEETSDSTLGNMAKSSKQKDEVDIERSRSGERRAISYVLSGVILISEIVLLALLNG
jgi:hypothetical protein